MNYLRFKIIILLFFNSLSSFAYDAEINGIYYFFSGTTATVTYFQEYNHSTYKGSIIIPESVVYNDLTYSVTAIGTNAFYGCSGMTSVTIPNSVTSIDNSAFEGCRGLTSVTIPSSVNSIGYCSFAYCSGLNSIVVEQGNTIFDSRNDCNAIINTSSNSLLVGCRSTIIPNNVTSIGDAAFMGCNGLISMNIPNSVTSIGLNAFSHCNSLTSVTIPNSVVSIDGGAFALCSSLTSASIPNSVTTIGDCAFQSCYSLTSVIIPNNVTYIGNQAFQSCSSLTSVNIPNCVTYIGYKAFDHCYKLKEVKSEINDPYYIDNDVFSQISAEAILYVPNGTKEKYQVYTGWSKHFKEIIENTTNIYTLSIKSTGNGDVSYNGGSIREQTSTFTVNEGSSATISFSPDDGYRIKNLTVNGSDVTSSVSDNQYTISNINSDTNVEVEFEPITYTLSIKATGNGSASFGDSTIKNQTSTFTVNESSSATITFSPDSGNKIKSVMVNSTDMTSSVSSNQYTIGSITSDTNVEVEFEPITYTLSIKASGNGSASYSGSTIKNQTSTFTVNEGSSATITFSPDSGNKIKSVKVNDTDVTSSVSSNQYTISSITGNTNVEVEFEPITYTLSIKASGNGSASYSGSTIKNKTSTFTVNEGSSATITFSPDTGNKIKSVKVNSTDVTSSVYSNEYTINSITDDTDVEVEFEAITYTLSVKATGSGAASYDGTTVRDKTSTFTVNEGTAVSISIYPDNGYRIKSVKENDTDVTSYVSDGIYTINSISRDTEIEVEFEAIPATTYSLSIKATGNGSASYDGNTIRNTTNTFTVNEGASAKITFSPDSGYRIKSVRVNSADVTSSVSGNQYTISNIASDTSVDVEFEAIPATTYTLSIKATGNGSASYDGNTIRNTTKTFTVNDGASATISFSSDDGYRIKTVKVNDVDMTSSVSSSQYTINSISADTNVEVEFEAIPATTYSLSIMATGNGTVTYDGNTIRNTTNSFTVNEGTSVKIAFSPDSGYRIKGVKVNGTDVTSSVSGNQYTISNIASDTSVEVEFEAIPVNTYTLNIVVAGNGSATYNDTDVRNGSETFTVNEGSTVTVVFSPDNGNRLNTVKMNGTDVTSQVSGNSYTVNNIAANTDLEVSFKEDVNALTVDGVNYSVVSKSDKTVNVVGGNYGKVLTVPATVTSDGTTWKVVGVEADALNGNSALAAIIWNPEVAFTAAVSNPNLLLYMKAEEYAPTAIQNVIVNGTASKIVLKEAGSGNGFYCPLTFTAQQISYTHNYQMQTGIGESKGWETIALPFDVQTITHETKGTIVPFAQWNNESDKKPFWLMELTGTGFVETNEIKAYTPYIISMPNHPQYDSKWLLNGKVTFAASGVTIGKTENLNQPTFSDRTFVPCFADMGSDMGIYALNVNNDFETNNSGMTEGSKFVLNMRSVHPFEAYMTSSSSAPCYAIGVFEDMTTGIQQMVDGRWSKDDVVYDLQGRRVERPSKKGMYMINGKKMIIK